MFPTPSLPSLPSSPPIVWSVAGTDSGGGAGLAADARAVHALGVHLCPVPAAITAQNSQAVTLVHALDASVLQAQLDALAHDLPPRVIKTGLLGSAANARALARTLDRLRQRAPVALVLDPVLRASTGAAFADKELLRVYRDELLPRACVITPNRREAQALLGLPDADTSSVPEQALALQALGAASVCITGGDAAERLANDWLHSPHASGWLSLPRVASVHHHGSGCTFASALAAALALGFVSADAAVLAKMLSTHALRQSYPLGQGAGPVCASAGFGTDPTLLPRLSLEPTAPTDWPQRQRAQSPGVYAIVDSAQRVRQCLSAGVRTLQLRIKRPAGLAATDPAWIEHLSGEIRAAQAAAQTHKATLYINDHWQLALEQGARALHLGQEDLLALSAADRARLAQARADGVALGLSTHSLWELCRAAALLPDAIACGPVWPTRSKDMPWHPQGQDNLAWWAHMAPAPVLAIGGILTPEQLAQTARSGAAGGCVLRGLGTDPALSLPHWLAAWERGLQAARPAPPDLPHPSLPGPAAPITPPD
ncbi:bifunctional hydroxymethylpyrimidine kinase/phosphomethylpyrimidine kinase [Hydrogenophaga sp.]|uniref:bifunctional hydroxymethylpyrimidine kinase/phosphomethylpyrimidine kinase n=1 Tax=Hydrogenophaga sp. TaxID=1904254 RepID=UPI00198EA99D|nr:bifunctional hydroxymethylpyrimidine kinase/phosphomethylpyrimidine kinase [Hydrogenophaga sp.]MBD3892338.1 bifunctional hydroxymethylpyrimidine kinase/phosphomethylpyrimidine kinase [Hydrogenophaga sp.]